MVRKPRGTSGQMHTIEGISAAMLLLLSLTFAFQSIGLTSTTATTSSGAVEGQISQLANDVIKTSKESGALRTALLDWNSARRSFDGALDEGTQPYFQGRAPDNRFGRTLELMLGDNDLAYNVDIVYRQDDDNIRTRYIYNGAPSRNSVTVSTTMVLSEDEELSDGTRIENSNYPVGDVPEDGLYNIVEVELTAWRR